MQDELFEEYSKEKEPTKYQRTYAWRTAIGLQKVDGLEPSEYLIKTAAQSINGEISFDDANTLITSYYKENKSKSVRTEEADKVSVRIAHIISENSFVFSPVEFKSIHKRLFEGIYSHAGKIRDYNISKAEWVLDGDTVIYGNAYNLGEVLDYDFNLEKSFQYQGLSTEEMISHLARFVSNLWQIHIFGEGNTRTTAVFLIKYLSKLGFSVTNDTFAENAWYFRNALVRANYNNRAKNVTATTHYLEIFLRNLLLGEENILSNREMHIAYREIKEEPKAAAERAELILELLRSDPKITIAKISERLGKSIRAVNLSIKFLQEKGAIERVGSKKSGSWKVNV